MDPSRIPPSSETDDDIIELTDIVEKGSVPPAPGDSGDGDSSLDSLMADLLAGSDEASATEEEDFDLDALLKASGLDDEGELADTNAAAPAGGTGASSVGAPSAAPLDSADLGDVDALLRDLVAPEQPAPPSAEGQAAAPADFGTVLQSSVERENAGQHAPAGDTGTGSEVGVDDLDSLLASIMDPETEAAPAQASAAPAPAADLGDLDDLLGEPQPASPAAGPSPEIPKKASAPATTAQRAATPSAVKAPAAEPEGDLDLDALLGEAPAPAPAKAPAPAPASIPDTRAPMEEDDDPLSGLDELLAEPEKASPVADASAEVDLGDPLLVGEADMSAPDRHEVPDGRAGRANRVSANIAAVQKKMADLAAGNGGADASAFNALRECVDDLAAEVRDLAESYASGLAAAEARISTLEAELAAGGAPAAMSGDMAQLEQRLEVVETSVEKAAAEAAARIIREEIAALLAEMGPEV